MGPGNTRFDRSEGSRPVSGSGEQQPEQQVPSIEEVLGIVLMSSNESVGLASGRLPSDDSSLYC
jgi:hypothetical protein